MGLAIAELMHFYGGAMTEEQILRMPFSKFLMYREYMNYILGWNSEKGAERNKMLDKQDRRIYAKKKVGWFQKVKESIFKPQTNG